LVGAQDLGYKDCSFALMQKNQKIKAAWAFAENSKAVQTGCFDHFGSRHPPDIAAESEAPL